LTLNQSTIFQTTRKTNAIQRSLLKLLRQIYQIFNFRNNAPTATQDDRNAGHAFFEPDTPVLL